MAATSSRLVDGLLAFAGCGVATIVGADGTPAWRVVRVAAVVVLTIGAVLLARRPARGTRALVPWAAGLVATSVGLGIGGPHLAKGGAVLATAAGVVCLLAGFSLLVLGGQRLVGLVRGWPRKVPVAVGAILASSVVVFAVGQAIAATNVPPTELGPGTPADLGFDYQDVQLPTADGVALSGWYIPSANGAAVVVMHGAGSTRTSVLDHAGVLATHGYGVLLFDARGHGRSEGRAMDFGWYGDADARAAVDFLVRRPDVDPQRIAAIGLSMGGEEAIGAAAADSRIAAVVAEGATTRTAQDKDWLSDEYGWRGAAQEGVEELVYAVTDVLTAASPPTPLRVAVAVTAPRPVLLITAGAVPDEAHAARHIASGSPETVDVWTVEGAAHTGALDTERDEWEARVVTFLDTALAVDDTG
jgi:uncharacterized protein